MIAGRYFYRGTCRDCYRRDVLIRTVILRPIYRSAKFIPSDQPPPANFDLNRREICGECAKRLTATIAILNGRP